MELSNNSLTDIYTSSDKTVQFVYDQGMALPGVQPTSVRSYPTPESRNGEVTVTKVDSRVLQIALGMTADRSCLEIGDDGSILVKNFPGQFGS